MIAPRSRIALSGAGQDVSDRTMEPLPATAALLGSAALLATAVLLAMLCGTLGCSRDRSADEVALPGPIPQPWFQTQDGSGPWNLLLITLDTTRSDRLGCYGCRQPLTPHLDRLAERGILFEQAITPVPVTLPAHCTIMTGLDPHEHGVRTNGTFVLDSTQITLAEVLSERGYMTGATLAALPVQAQFGISQGFATYEDDLSPKGRMEEWEMVTRRGNEVTRLALAWIEMHREQPFFHWAHYFDPHAPYDPPEPYKSKFDNPYDGEVAFMDAQVGALISGIEELGLLENTWILCVGDHGESLGEHGEASHSMTLHGATQCVPCVLYPPAKWGGIASEKIRGRRIRDVVALRDLAPTLLNALGFEMQSLPASGSSLLPMIAGACEGPGAVYMETLAPFLKYSWSELRGVRATGWSYIRAPEPELYDLVSDPRERRNVCSKYPEIAERLSAWLNLFLEAGSEALVTQTLDPETMAQLRSLGYVAGPAPRTPSANEKDPKARMHIHQKMLDLHNELELRPAEAKGLLLEVLQEDPDNQEATRLLGKALLRLSDWQGAQVTFKELLDRFPDDHEARVNWAWTCMMTGQQDEARRALSVVLEENPRDSRARAFLGALLLQLGRPDDAREVLDEGTRVAPEKAEPIVRLGMLEWQLGNHAKAQDVAREALAVDEHNASAHALLGETLWLQGKGARTAGQMEAADQFLARAKAELEEALSLDMDEPMAAFRLGWLADVEGDTLRAFDLYYRTISRRPDMPQPHVNLGHLLRKAGRPQEALHHYEVARSLGYEDVGLMYNYGALLASLGRRDEAKAALERAFALAPNPETAGRIRDKIQALGSR